MKKRLLSLLLVTVMLVALFTGCGTDSAEETKKTTESSSSESKDSDAKDMVEVPEETTLKVMMFGEKPLGLDTILDEFYARTADTLNVKLEIEFNPTADHKQKLLLLASAGEEYDLVFDAPWMQLKTLSKDGAYQPLDAYFNNDDYPGLKANFSEDYLNSNKYFGQVYGVPITKTVASAEAIGIRTDLMEKYGFDEIKDYDQLQEFFDVILENEPDMVPLATEGRVGFFRMLQPELELDNIFVAGDFFVALSEDNTKVLGATYKFGSETYGGDAPEYIADFPAPWNDVASFNARVETYSEWSKYLEEDVLTQTDPKGFFAAGKAAALNRGYQEVTTLKTLNDNMGLDTDLYAFPFKQSDRDQVAGTTFTNYKVWNFMCVPITSTKIDRSMAFLDWIFQSEENHDLFELGIEGTHWNAVGDSGYEIPADLDNPYVFPWYQLTGTPNMSRLNSELPETAKEFINWQMDPSKYTLSPMTGFDMNYENVKTEKASIDAIYTAISSGIVNGAYENPVEIVELANEEATKAGLNKLREETIAQVQAFLDNK